MPDHEGNRVPLSTLIRQSLDAVSDPDVNAVLDEVMSLIPEHESRSYLREAVRARIGSDASRARTLRTPDIRKGVSMKQQLIRDEYWPAFLRQRVFLPSGPIFLSQATITDLYLLAERRRTSARELTFRAEQFETLAGLMATAGVLRLEDLDEAAAAPVLGRVA